MQIISSSDLEKMVADAKEKVKRLKQNQMIRLYGGTHQQSYWVANISGKLAMLLFCVNLVL